MKEMNEKIRKFMDDFEGRAQLLDFSIDSEELSSESDNYEISEKLSDISDLAMELFELMGDLYEIVQQ